MSIFCTVCMSNPCVLSFHPCLIHRHTKLHTLFYLTVHLGVCSASSNCPGLKHPGPCGCPDCKKPHPPHAFDGYCDSNHTSSSSTTSSYQQDSSSGSGSSSGNSTSQDQYGNDSSKGNGQNASRVLKIWALVAAAAVAATAGGALMMRNRVRSRICLCFLLGTFW
jgi:hypothetical protein